MGEREMECTAPAEAPGGAEKVDLNKVFREDKLDLNSMFPDDETRSFLRQLKKNQRSNERFLQGFKKDRLWERDE